MKNRIISLLINSLKPLKGKELASILKVSDRTIRNTIKEINSVNPIIKSSQQGYIIDNFNTKKNISINNVYTFDNQSDRILLIVERILTSNSKCNLYDIADSLFISYSTIEKDIQSIKDILIKYNLHLVRSKGSVAIQGNETDERLLIHDLLRKSNNMNVDQLLSDMSANIGIEISEIKNVLLEEIINNNLYVNDYALKNIIIHVIVSLTRIKNNNFLKNAPDIYQTNDYILETSCAEGFIHKLKERYNIIYNEVEKKQLVFLIISKTSRKDMIESTSKLYSIISKEYVDFTYKLISQINDLYYIDLNDKDFVNFFSIHLGNVIFRSMNNTYNKNPFANSIYIQNPLIYDIATFIANQIDITFNCKLNRDEITFIALHVGAVIERYNQQSNHISAILLINDYYYFKSDVMNKIENIINNSINLTVVKSTLDNINLSKYNFIINAAKNDLFVSIPTIDISPFLNEKDLMKIQEFIRMYLYNQNKKKAKDLFIQFFNRNQFELEHYEDGVEQMIIYMTNKLLQDKLVPKSFQNAVLERERLTPTSFDNMIAIPHSIVVSAIENCSYVIINKRPMKWGYFEVNIIILLGVNHAKRNMFKELYESLLELITNEKIVDNLINSKSYDDFINILINT